MNNTPSHSSLSRFRSKCMLDALILLRFYLAAPFVAQRGKLSI